MNKTICTYGAVLVMSMALIGMPGCSKKSVQSGGDSQSSKGGSSDGSRSGVGGFPDTGIQ